MNCHMHTQWTILPIFFQIYFSPFNFHISSWWTTDGNHGCFDLPDFKKYFCVQTCNNNLQPHMCMNKGVLTKHNTAWNVVLCLILNFVWGVWSRLMTSFLYLPWHSKLFSLKSQHSSRQVRSLLLLWIQI